MSRRGSCAQYGMIALSPVTAGETLFEIPRRVLLTAETSSISELLDNGMCTLISSSSSSSSLFVQIKIHDAKKYQ